MYVFYFNILADWYAHKFLFMCLWAIVIVWDEMETKFNGSQG